MLQWYKRGAAYPKSWYIDDTFWEVYGKRHYDKLSDYQSVAKEVKRNDDTMILFSKKKTFRP